MKKHSTMGPKFKQLLAKFHEGRCSLNELYELHAFFEKDELSETVKQQMFLDLEQQEGSGSGQFQPQQVFAKLKEQIRKNQRKTEERAIPVLWKIAKVAAIVLLSFVLGGLAVHFLRSEENGTTVTYTEVVAPLGAKSKVVLPDQSVVWLNAGSKIKYSTDFNKNNRHVTLVGEGYFQVEKNKELPFMVDALGFLVEAVGTEFNIQAYEEEPTIETILVEGKVRLDHQTESIAANTYLNPNSKASFFKDAGPTLRDGHPRLVIDNDIDPLPLISWKDDRYIFKSELLKDLVVVLGRKYNFTFKFDSEEIQNYRFSGTLEDETLQQVMDVITITSPISYEIEGKVVSIKKDINRTKNFRKY